ncbi:amino acid adenylation domain-containing protein [Microcoleus sp. BROC3]|uniref:amino acid adenylation domain-containing protein n=1 Tax=Microcoleus sp. BROC3 TaxID=3055323 RepID=UPI002FD25460
MVFADQPNKSKNIESIYPLSPMQEGMLFHSLYEPESGVYFEQFSFTVHGNLDISAFELAWRQVVERHPVLRTSVVWKNRKKPLQVVRKSVNLPWTNLDWRELSPIEQEHQLEVFLQADTNKSFEFDKAPLMRCALIKLTSETYKFVWSFHHLLMDGWCTPIIFKEVLAFYEASKKGFDLHLSATRPYSDYIAWLQQQDKSIAIAYWQDALSGFTAPTPLVVDRTIAPNSQQKKTYLEHHLQLSATTTATLKSLAQKHRITVSTFVQGAWALLLSRYSGEQDVVFGVTVSGRPPALSGVESMVGLFINTLPVRVQVESESELLPWLMQLQQQQVERDQYSYSALSEIQRTSEVPGGSSLFESIVVFENYPLGDSLLSPPDGLQIDNLQAIERTNYPLTLAVTIERELSIQISYDYERFDADTIARMGGHLLTLLEGMVATESQKLKDLPLLTPAESHQLLVEWNNTKQEYLQDKCIHQLFEEQVERSPDAIAVVFEEEQLTYRELNQRANRIAHYLKTLGVEPEVLVGICVERSLEMMVGLLGILKAGGAYVPLDPAYPFERLSLMIEDAQPSVLLTQERLVEELPSHWAQVICLDSDWQSIGAESTVAPVSGATANNLAYVIYTSGSTGKPKGVMIPHRAICNHMLWMQTDFPLSETDKVLQKTPFSFDASVWEFYAPLLVGAQLVMTRPGGHRDSDYLIQTIVEQKITTLQLVPTLLRMLLENDQIGIRQSLKNVFCGGEPLTVELQERFKAHLNAELHNLYGPTETCIDAAYWTCKRGLNQQIVPIGRPIANTSIYILDRHLQSVPIGVPGEVHIGGAGVARGYLNQPELTLDKFIPNPYSNEPGSRLYKTGDKARYLPDGNIEFLGRLDNQVKIRGFRIELGEIEAAIAQYPGVRETVVMAREDVPDRKYLVAYIVPNHDSVIASSDLRVFLKEKLPDYMIPGAFVHLDALPLTPNGKVDRKALPTPDTARQELQVDRVAPRTISEETLAQIWREVFHREFISIHDNFFEVGGDSILSIQIISKANSAGLHLTVKQIFQHQTIADLAAVATTTETSKAEQGLVAGPLPLTPIQHWFKAQNLPNPHHFNQAFLLEVPPTLNPDLLQQALQQLIVHHDALRLRFNQSEACWQQFNALPDETVPFSLIDLSTLQEEALSQTIESTSSQLQATLNLNSGPLLRVALFHLGTQKPSRLLLVIHHLAVDGVSWRILLEDLQTAYQQLESGKAIQLPPKTTSFKHWAEKLTEYAFSPAAKKELTYWSNISTSKITHLPVDSRGGANTKASARSVKVSLTSDETRALLQEIHKAYRTQINDILLTALVQVLATWSGSESVIIDLEGHGREEILPDVDLSRTVGWFTTIFPVLLELKATENLPDAIESIKEQLRAVPNRGIGCGLLRYLSGDAEITSQLSSLPQAEVSFNYLGQFNWGMQSDSFIKLAPESVGSEHSQLGHRSHLLEINGLVVENQLQLEWTYSENFHSSGTIESLARDFAARLRTLIAHCLSADARNYTLDVFENQTIHREVHQPINNDRRQDNNVPLPLHLLELSPGISELLPDDTESAYPIAKMQEFMLHHYVNDPQKMGVYHCQLSYDIYDESLDLNAFKKALLILVQKHSALRTVFITSNGKPTVQVVKKKLRFFINEQDISHIKSEEQSNYIDAVMKQDRHNLFDIENPNEPLFRFRIFQKAENKFEFLMSIHHAITDGWGNLKFLNELYEIYSTLKKGEEITVVPAANVYKEFVALEKEILSSQDAADFWKLHLKDHTYKPLKPLTTSVEQVEAVTEKYKFEEEIIADLRELCRKLRVSPKALFLSTYLDLIGTVMKSNRVCVGVVSNGRTERLSDPFGALGLFWNIVPFCQPTQEDKGVQIKNVQQSLIDIESYVRYPLLEILAGQQKPELFFATFNFVNFHNAKNIKADTGLKVKARKFHDKFNFPLNYAVSMEPSSGNVNLSVEYDKMYFSGQEIRSMIQNYIEMFNMSRTVM